MRLKCNNARRALGRVPGAWKSCKYFLLLLLLLLLVLLYYRFRCTLCVSPDLCTLTVKRSLGTRHLLHRQAVPGHYSLSRNAHPSARAACPLTTTGHPQGLSPGKGHLWL